MIESETDKYFSQSTLQQTSQKHFQTNDAAILQREREINDIATGIIELADIFKELQSMVIDQGTMLDRIDYNVEKMAENVKGADKELIVVGAVVFIEDLAKLILDIQATGYQRKTTKRKILLFLLLLVVGMFILLLVKPKGHHSQSESAAPPSTDHVTGSKAALAGLVDVDKVGGSIAGALF